MKKILLLLFVGLLPFAIQAQVQIHVDATQPAVSISPMLYGIFYEDINHAADGGIYAELIRNRSFEDNDTIAEAWAPLSSASAHVQMSLVTDHLLNSVQQHALHVVTTVEGNQEAGVQNGGFWGINAVKGRTYKVSLWVKVKRSRGLSVMLSGKDGTVYASAPIAFNSKEKGWQHITTTITSSANDPEALFAITSSGSSDFCLDMVSLFPPTYKNRDNGLRPGLVEMLYELHPRFMRFPGGCFVEGQDTPDNAFRWERTIGPVEERPGHWNKNWGYRTSDGLGFHEYLLLAEDLGAKPLYVTNIGIWHGGVTPMDSLQMWIDECLNALEYANGDITTKYGALRAKNGHPTPFNIEYIEIGNENNQTDGQQTSDHYYDRYRAFRSAILCKYPNMHIIGDVEAWGTDHPHWATADPVDLVDEHYYRSPVWFTENFHKYDSYPRTGPQVYCGEYAVTEGFGTLGNLNAALGEAVFMMGMENNADIVGMSSYAPIFVNENDDRWRPDMVRFNSQSVMGTPSYYVQKLMAENLGTRTLNVLENAELHFANNDIFTPDSSFVGFATWGTHATFADIRVTSDINTVTASGENATDFNLTDNTWQTTSEGIAQTGEGTPAMVLINRPIHGQKYTISFRGRRDGGREGFMVLFNYKDKDNYCWLNIAGNRNTSHRIEEVIGGGKGVIIETPGHVETGRWYDVRLDVDGNNLTAYLDGEQIFTTQLRGAYAPGLYTSASLDDATDEIILKIVNTSSNKESAVLNLDGVIAKGAELIQLKGSSGDSENTLLEPTLVYPTHRHIALEGTTPTFLVEPFSLNILRIKR